MLPTLFTLGSFSVHSFGVMVAAGFLMSVWWCVRESARLQVNTDRILDLSFWLLISGFIGARLLFVAVNHADYGDFFSEQLKEHGAVMGGLRSIVEALAVWKGGIVWYGGMLTALGVGLLYIRSQKMPVWATADLVAPGVMLGLAFGRIGCLLAGDDHGKVIPSAWAAVQAGGKAPWYALTFTNADSLIPEELLGIPLYPTQIMMSLKALLVFGVLVWLRKRKTFHGQVIWVMMALYSVLRYVVEFYRGDDGRGFVIDGLVSTSQFIGIVTFVFSLGMLAYCRKTQRVSVPSETPAAA